MRMTAGEFFKAAVGKYTKNTSFFLHLTTFIKHNVGKLTRVWNCLRACWAG